MGRWVRSSTIAVSLLAAGCGGGASHVSHRDEQTAALSPATPAPSPGFPCDQYIDTHPPPADYTVLLGVVALPVSPKARALQTARSGLSDASLRLFSKTGLLLRAGSGFRLVVPAEFAGRLRLGWGSPAPQGDQVTVKGCRPRAPGGARWLAYPGGFWVDHQACVSLLVEAAGRRQRVRFGLGKPCPGQRPPEGPNQS